LLTLLGQQRFDLRQRGHGGGGARAGHADPGGGAAEAGGGDGVEPLGEGRREAAFLDAEAREREAEAEAKATAMVSAAINEGDVQAVNYFIAQKYTEALQGIASAPNSKTVMIPLEATGVIGSVAGIVEIAKEALKKEG